MATGNALFDAYLARYPDVAADRGFARDPMSHYQRFGQAENRMWGLDQQPAAPAAPAADPGPMVNPEQVGWTPGLGANDAHGWDTFRHAAQQHTAGMNRRAFVFDDYAGISTDPARAQSQMFHQMPEAVQGAVSPLFSALLGAIAPAAGGAAAAAPNAGDAAYITGENGEQILDPQEYVMMHPGDPRSKAEAERRRKEQRAQAEGYY